MLKIYLCEGNAEGVKKVTGFDNPTLALNAAKDSKEKVRFISTVNPLENSKEAESGQFQNAKSRQ